MGQRKKTYFKSNKSREGIHGIKEYTKYLNFAITEKGIALPDNAMHSENA